MSQEIQTLPEAGPLEPVGEVRETTVIATTREQMLAAQQVLVRKAESRIAGLHAEIAELRENLEIAKKNKLKISTIQDKIQRNERRVTFYQKLKAAFEEGFVLIPDMDLEVFAVRTTRELPKQNYKSIESPRSWDVPVVPDVEASRAPVGEGEYVSPRPHLQGSSSERKNEKGETVYSKDRWADAFAEEITFPFALAKPRIVDLTTRAMALKIFDEIGVLPNRVRRNSDPMVVGRVLLKEGWQTKRMNFLVCWFVETEDI